MAGTSELEVVSRAEHDDAAVGAKAEESAPAIMPLVAMAEMVAAAPELLAEAGAECLARVQPAAAELEQRRQWLYLPLLAELEQSLAAPSTPPSANVCSAVAAAMDLLARALKSGEPPPRARSLIAIAELRSVRGAPTPWRSPLIEYGAAGPVAAREDAESPAPVLSRLLAAYRRSLLAFLKSDDPDEAGRLSELCRRVSDAVGEESERRRWLAAAALFQQAGECGGVARPLIKRLAVKLEQVLRHLSEGTGVNEPGGDSVSVDLEVLGGLLRQVAGAADPGEDPALGMTINALRLASALESLADGAEDPGALLGGIADAFLLAEDYEQWLEAHRLATRPEGGQALEAAVSRWRSRVAANVDAAPTAGDNPPSISGVPVDEALLQNLDLMAREIRGARSRAEANLGSLKGGLVDMDRSIRKLRLQLESLEVVSQVREGEPGAGADDPMPSGFGALSRGIEELAGLKDALQSLTEETESALAAQAGEDTQLEQGLLKTRMMPVGAQFEALCQRVGRAAAGRGIAATLSARGAEVALERSQADALTRALGPLLEACVHQGLVGGIAPAGTDPGRGRIELEVSQPRFDVRVDITYAGVPLSRAALAESAPGLDALGATVASLMDGEGRALVRVSIPGPPQPMDLLRLEVSGNRIALPLEDVRGVSRPPEAGAAPGSQHGYLKLEGKLYRLASLADALGLDTASAGGSACILVQREGSLLALRVDAVIGRECSLVRSPGPLLSSNPWVLGVVVDARAAPTLVLDLRALEISPASAAG